MSTPAAPSHRSHAGKAAKKPFWKRDLGDLGKGGDEEVDHPPFEPTLPRVDVLPDQVRESILLRKIRRALIAIAVIIAIGLGALWYLQGSSIDTAQASLDETTVENQKLQASAQALVPVQQMYTQITNQQEVVRRTLASQPQAATVLVHLLAAADSVGGRIPLAFNVVTVGYTGVPAPGGKLNPCPKPNPFEVDVAVGCVTFSAGAQSRDQVTALLTALAADDFFVGPFVNVTSLDEPTTGGGQTVSFTGTAGVSPAALQTPLTDEELATLVAPPAPSPSASPGAGG
jgi:hypothetical protein